MSFDQTGIPLRQLVSLFCGLLVAGIFLTLPLFKFNYRKFFHSSLFTKIVFWIPIFLVVLALLYTGNNFRLGVLLALFVAAFAELWRSIKKSRYRLLPAFFYLLFIIGLGHFYFLETTYTNNFINLLISLSFATVLADVTAFFLGNYLGKHKLPAIINKNKSWEGVLGELIGAFVGLALVNIFVQPVISKWLFLPIGIGSIVGDLSNSAVKRRLAIKDWGNAIPGHGGFIDRLSSIAGSVALTFYFLRLTF
ncbi:MAG TPA: phosphatidate cytidylyltransferase [Candidatus Saccharimonadales bacterium]|nr:phosphatidate cytidylyltransferase [Candidatus Saccharimonadales bacterium]